MLCALGPMAFTNIRADFSEYLECTDASSSGLGGVISKIPKQLSKSLFLNRERRGGYTRLAGRHAEALLAAGHSNEDDFALPDVPLVSPTRLLVEVFDLLEICCGPGAPLSHAFAKQNLRSGPRINVKAHSFWDSTNEKVFAWVLFLLRNRRVRHFHSGVPCTTFSLALCPKLRSKGCPWGFDPKETRTSFGNFMMQS